MNSTQMGHCRIVKVRQDEWELHVKGDRSGLMMPVVQGIPFEVANDAKNKINSILQSISGRYYSADTRPEPENPESKTSGASY